MPACPSLELYVALRDRLSITHDLGKSFAEIVLSDVDRVAFPGPAPLSRGYGAPVI